jgi:hypothetical protein
VRTAAALLLSVLAACWPAAAVAGAVTDLADWLQREAERIRELPDGEARTAARHVAGHLERRLREAGLDASLATALAAAPGTAAPEEGEESGDAEADDAPPRSSAWELAAGIDLVARRLRRFDQACAGEPVTQPAGAREELVGILAEPVFDRTPPQAGWGRRFGYEVRRRLGRLLGGAVGFAVANGALIFAAAVLVFLAALAFIVSRVVQARGGSRWTSHSGSAPAAEYERGEPAPASPAWLVGLARNEAAAGRGARAMHLLVQAALLALRTSGLLPDDPGLTDLESLERLEPVADASVRGELLDLVELHDRGVYGGAGVRSESVTRALEIAERLVAGTEAVR